MILTICVVLVCILVGCFLLSLVGFHVEFSNGISLVRAIVVTSIMITCVALPATYVWGWVQNKNQKQAANLVQFLTEHDPSLKTKRDEIVRMITEIKEKRKYLQSTKRKYKSEEARSRVDHTILQVDTELERMESDLEAIDVKIELAMVAKDLRKADASGLHTAESNELSANADAVLKQANELSQLLESEGGVVKPAATPSAPPNTIAKSSESASQAQADTRVKESPKSTATTLPMLAMDPEAIAKEIRRLDAAIAINEANLNRAWARINQITRHGTGPIVKGSRQHIDYLAAHRVLEDCEAQLPAMKKQRDQLKSQFENLR